MNILRTLAVTALLFAAGPIFAEGKEFQTYSKPNASEIKKKLTPKQFEVTQHEGTERPFSNAYWHNEEPGIYVDIVSGEPLFSSQDKFDSGTGWPSFFKPLEPSNIVTKTDKSFLASRTEVRSKYGNSHLGHVFDDGPQPTGLRYCMNSASLRFIAADKLVAAGYGKYSKVFEKKQSQNPSAQPLILQPQKSQQAIFAGGCFWSMESAFGKANGILNAVVGFTGGQKKNPTYEEVSTGTTGHLEPIQITFDPNKVSFQQLLDLYWHNIDPTSAKGQFVDEGDEYRPAIFYSSPEQRIAAEESLRSLAKSGRFNNKIVVQILPSTPFYAAEDYHQHYYIKNAAAYLRYRKGSGRDAFFDRVWGSSH